MPAIFLFHGILTYFADLHRFISVYQRVRLTSKGGSFAFMDHLGPRRTGGKVPEDSPQGQGLMDVEEELPAVFEVLVQNMNFAISCKCRQLTSNNK